MKAGDIGTIWCGTKAGHGLWWVHTDGLYRCDKCQAGLTEYEIGLTLTPCQRFVSTAKTRVCPRHPAHSFQGTKAYSGVACLDCQLECVTGTGTPDNPHPFRPITYTPMANTSPTATPPAWSMTGPTHSAYVTPAKTVSWRPVGQTYATPIDMDTPAYIVKTQRLCECGSHVSGAKDYGPGHSSWCPARDK